MKKRLLSILLAIALLFSLVPGLGSVAVAEESHKYTIVFTPNDAFAGTGWTKVGFYYWNNTGLDWPGTEMSQSGGSYTLTFETSTVPTGFIINDGNIHDYNDTAAYQSGNLAFVLNTAVDITLNSGVTIGTCTITEIHEYTVTLTGGEHATPDKATTQTGLTGAMEAVTYTAHDGYHFDDFTPIESHGITAQKTDNKTVTVSGTPDADVTIAVPDAVEDLFHTVTVPSSLTVEHAGWTAASGITAASNENKTLKVLAHSANGWAMKSGDNTVSYVLSTADGGDKTTEWSFTPAELRAEGGTNKALGAIVGAIDALAAGTYTDTVTFTAPRVIKVENTLNWDNVKVYAWDDNLTDYFGAWPGKSIEAVNGVFEIELPEGTTGIILNSGTVQTADITDLDKAVYTFTGETDGEGHYTLTGSGENTPEVYGTMTLTLTVEAPTTYTVTLTGGEHATPDKATTQSGLTGAMETVTYTAHDGYHFDDFTPIESHGITAQKTDNKTVTVSGTPDADVTIAVPDAVHDTYTVTLTGGEHATPDKATTQSGLTGAMETVTYTAHDGYHFDDFTPIESHGITVQKTDNKTVTVSGTPDADVTIAVPNAVHDTYTVTLTGGEHATPDKATTQTGLTGAMETVTYTAHDGYHFDDFTPIESHGITVQKTDAKTVTVSGTPDADVTIAVPNAVHDTYTVTLTGGEHATPDKATTQTGLTGAMETVTYTAHDGYHFDDFTPIESHGITAQKTDNKTVTVSGTPDADVTIAVPDAVHDTYTVTLTGGEHATPDKATTQTGLTGAMETVTYTAHDGYHFDDFTPIESHGITVQKTDAKTVTVSGTPDADVTIAVPNAVHDTYTVTLTGGEHATPDKATTQTGLTGAMETVTYTAHDGYHFDDFTPIESHGITAQKTDNKTVTVSGTPDADVTIAVPNAVHDTYTVTLTGGEHATPDKATTQTGLTGAMETVTYTAHDGYHFDDFTPIESHGITVQKTDAKTVTVSGTPDADVTIAVPNAAEDPFHTVTVPTALTVEHAGWTATSGITAASNENKTLKVLAHSANGWAMKSGDNSVSYVLSTADGGEKTTEWSFTPAELRAEGGTNKALGAIVGAIDALAAGTYTDTVTFTAPSVIKVENTLNWDNVKVYAWDTNLTAYFGAWPGMPIEAVNGVFEIELPEGTTGIIVNSGTVQTADITDLDKAVYTFTGETDGEGHYTLTGSGENTPEVYGTLTLTLTVEEPPTYTVTAPTASAITYGQKLSDSTLSGGKMVFGDVEVAGTFTWKDATVKPVVADSQTTEYLVVFTPSDTASYPSAEFGVKLTVNPKPAKIIADDKTKTYGDPDPEFTGTVEGVLAGDELNYSFERRGGDNVGQYKISVSIGANDNYDVTAVDAKLTIVPKAAFVTADAKSKVYDNDASTDPTLTATVAGAVNGETLNYTLSRTAGQNVDEYDITVTLGSNPNYTVTSTGAKFTITPKAAKITADAKSKVYDNDASTDPVLTATVEGVVAGDALSYTLSRAEGQNVGQYDITVTPGSNPNYAVETVGAKLTITQKAAKITADAMSKVYGSDDPELTATVEGVVAGDTLNYTLSRAAGQNVGQYDITVTLGSNPNYAVETVGAKLTITQKTATVKADDKTKTYGDADPALTAQTAGLVGTDTLNYTLSRAEGDNVGTYTITVTLGSNPNYAVTATGATLTITQKAATIKADDKTKTYGAADPELTAVIDGQVGRDELNYTLSRAEGDTVGEYAITVTLGSNPNYTIETTGAKLTITAATPTLSDVSATELTYGDTLAAGTLSGTAKNPNNGANVAGEWAFADVTIAPAVADSETTEYAVVFRPTDTLNYNEASTVVTVKVNKADPTFTPPTPKVLSYTGEPQELVNPGYTEDGTMLYSLDGEHFDAAIPTATVLDTYFVWYMVKGDANHNDTEPVRLTIGIALTLYGADVSSLEIGFIENGERLYRYDVRIKNLPEAFKTVGMQVFLSYDTELLTLKRIESDFDWISSESNNRLLLAWASDVEVPLTNDQVVFSLIFAASDDAAGEQTAIPFIANVHGMTSIVSAVVDGEIVDYDAATIDGCIRFAAPLLGDANCDGVITGADAALILRAIVGLDTLSAQGALNADVDGDLEITAEDAVLILRWIVGLIAQFPAAEMD